MHCLDLQSLDSGVRMKLSEVNRCVMASKKMVVLTGAGILCNAGIPDFRSADGLYNMAKASHLCVLKGKDLFDISLFRSEDTTQVFASFMEALYSHTTTASPTETHKFIKHLRKKNKLLRCYTQNIDALERKLQLNTGVIDGDANFRKQWKALDVVQLHGDLNYLTCTNCFANFDWTPDFRTVLAQGGTPDCPACLKNYEEKAACGKRVSSLSVGFLRPKIVLYGENHPNLDSISKGLSLDLKSRPDCLIIFGTSLRVDGVKRLVRTMAKEVHEKGGKVILVNKTQPSVSAWTGYIDYFIESDCDLWIRYLKTEIPDLFLLQRELDEIKMMKKAQRAANKGKKKIKTPLTPPPTPSSERTFTIPVVPSVLSTAKVQAMKMEFTPSQAVALTRGVLPHRDDPGSKMGIEVLGGW